MAIIKKLPFLLLLTLLALILPSHCYTKPDEREKSPEEWLVECFARCGKQLNQQWQTQCQKKCVDEYDQRKEYDEGSQHREQPGGGGSEGNDDRRDPEKQLRECLKRCEGPERGEEKLDCQQGCQQQYQEQRGRGRGGGSGTNEGERREQGTRGQQEGENVYYFQSSKFKSRYKSQEGDIRVLERFNKRSDLLRGAENNRLRLLVANPQTVILPHHNDAASVFVVLSGQGAIHYLWPPNQRRSFTLKEWDVIRVPAGSILYLINHHNSEKLYLLELLRPINIPGKFKAFFGTGGQNPESYLRSFSNEVLEAAFKSRREEVEKLFTQSQGAVVKVSEEQIRSLVQESESKEGQEEIWGPINLYQERHPTSNEYGQHFEASPEDHDQLRDLDVSVGLINITRGGMTAPYFNSRATKLVFVAGGKGKYEMICPHVGRKGSSQGGRGYERVTADLNVGDVFVFPNGHPIAIYATENSNLQLVSFGIKGSFNHKYYLAGQENVWNQIASAAREVSFNVPEQQLEEILKRQDKSYFLPGPGQQQGGRGRLVESMLEFAGF